MLVQGAFINRKRKSVYEKIIIMLSRSGAQTRSQQQRMDNRSRIAIQNAINTGTRAMAFHSTQGRFLQVQN